MRCPLSCRWCRQHTSIHLQGAPPSSANWPTHPLTETRAGKPLDLEKEDLRKRQEAQ